MLIKRVERNKRKYVTAVSGLEQHGMDLKKVAKEWGKKCELISILGGLDGGLGNGRRRWGRWGVREGEGTWVDQLLRMKTDDAYSCYRK